MKRTRKGSTFVAARASSSTLAVRPSALSMFWFFGAGCDNENVGRSTVVSIVGPLEQRASFWDGYDSILARFKEALAEEATDSVVLKIDSPGGDAAGCFEAVRMMRAAAEKSGKRVVAYVDESAYSAAYALACVASEIYLPPSGGVGSIGVIAACMDRVAQNDMLGLNFEIVYAGDRKADNHPDVPLSAEAIAETQDTVNALAGLFFETVAGSRGISVAAVQELQAACFMGDDGVSFGLADGIMGYDELLSMLATTDQPGAMPNGDAMSGKKVTKVAAKVSELGAADALAAPQVALPDQSTLLAVKASLGHDGGATPAAPAAEVVSEDTSYEKETYQKETTTTTTTSDEEEEASAEGDGDGEGDDEEETDGEEETDAAATAAAIAPAPARLTAGDVMRCVREITGLSSAGEQIGALKALKDGAKRAAKAEKEAGKAARLARVEGAIRAGKLAPAQRDWAMSVDASVLSGYLKNAAPVVRKTPLQQPTDIAAAAKVATKSTPVVDATILSVAKTMGLDPAKLAEHHAELVKSGVLH